MTIRITIITTTLTTVSSTISTITNFVRAIKPKSLLALECWPKLEAQTKSEPEQNLDKDAHPFKGAGLYVFYVSLGLGKP